MDTRMSFILLPIVALAALSVHYAHGTNSEPENEASRQHRLFSRLNNNWAIPMLGEPIDDEAIFDPTETRNNPPVNPGLKFLEELLENRQREENDEKSQAVHYDSERELDSSQPYGIQNVLDGTPARASRSHTRSHKTTYQSLCPSKRETVFLNLDPDYEYRPDYYEEVQCAHRPITTDNRIQSPVCSEAGFSCIQLNRTLFLTRRMRGEGCWESETRSVAAGCECMWPKHHLGDISHH